MRQRCALVVRIWLDEDGRLQGQVSDPMSDWKRPFAQPDQLWTLLHTCLIASPPPPEQDTNS